MTARADDPTVLYYNPAGLAELRGNQLLLNINFGVMSACVDPIGYYGWGAYGGGTSSQIPDPATRQAVPLNLGTNPPDAGAAAYYNGLLDTVCMSSRVLGVPQFAFTSRISERLGVGIGLIFPSATPQGHWGDENGVISTPNGPRPAATRYMLIRTGTIGLFPTVGLAYRMADWLRIGARFEWGMFSIDNTNMAAVSGGSTPANDIIARARALDLFVPAVTASVHLVPTDSLDIVGAIRIQDDIIAPGELDLTTGVFDPRALPVTTTNEITAIRMKMPWQLRAGIRYAKRLAPRPEGSGQDDLKGGGRIHDAMEDELWDVELDVQYEMNARNQQQVIDYKEMQSINFKRADGTVSTNAFPESPRVGEPTDAIIKKHWKDQWSIRLGGTYNVLPGLFSISLGAHYETRGIDPSYMQIDYWPVSRVGLHAGVKFRVGKSVDLVASYAHIFQETIVTGAPQHIDANDISKQYADTGEVNGIDKRSGVAPRGMQAPVLPEAAPAQVDGVAKKYQIVTKVPTGSPPYIINAGTYRSAIDVVAIGANVHF